MTSEQEARFRQMCERFGLDRSQTSEMSAFVEAVAEAARENGEAMGASPFDGSWPSEN